MSVLDHLKDNYDRFITTSQVEMEFKKNRQSVIIHAFKKIAKLVPESKKVLPAFLEEFQAASSLRKAEGLVRKYVTRLNEKTSRILEDPTRHDDVYKKAQRLFATNTRHNLTHPKKECFEIRDLARKRFDLGYPPRKDNDTSMGDAINWEWIIRCAKDSKCNVVIVSRDSDYGQLLGKQRVLNTWLRQEFYSRTSKRHQILLTDRLTDALEQANITVSSEEQQQESEFLEQWIPLPIVDIAQATKGMAGMAQFLEGIKLQQEQCLKFKLSELYGIRFDVRDHVTGKPFGLPGSSGSLHNVEYSVGFSLLF